MDAPALGRLLGAGKEAEVFAFGGGALKLYRAAAAKRSAFREAANAAVAESLELPVPKIHGLRRFGDRWGILMSLAEGPSFDLRLPHGDGAAPIPCARPSWHALCQPKGETGGQHPTGERSGWGNTKPLVGEIASTARRRTA